MRTRSAAVYQPAVPLRAVCIYFYDDGSHEVEDVPVLGVQMELTERARGSDEEETVTETRHSALVFGSLWGCILTAREVEEDHDNIRLVVAPASFPEGYWQDRIEEAVTGVWRANPEKGLGAAPGRDARGALEIAKGFLRGLLAGGKEVPAKDVEARAAERDISKATLNRAKTALAIVPRKLEFGGRWVWGLPPEGPQPSPVRGRSE